MEYNSHTIPIKKAAIKPTTICIISDSKISPFFEVNNISILKHQLDILHSISTNLEITYIGGAESVRVKSMYKDIRVIENNNFDNSHDAENIKLGLLSNINHKILFIKNSLILDKTAITDMIQSEDNLTVAKKIKSKKLSANIQHDYVTHINYGLNYEWFPIIMLSNDIIDKFTRIVNNMHANKMMHEVLNKFIDNNENIIKAVII